MALPAFDHWKQQITARDLGYASVGASHGGHRVLQYQFGKSDRLWGINGAELVIIVLNVNMSFKYFVSNGLIKTHRMKTGIGRRHVSE
ncbi:MAG: hypothetical protein ACFB03_09025 [Paracoccaceae bacterium]